MAPPTREEACHLRPGWFRIFEAILDHRLQNCGGFFGLDSGPKASQLDASRLISTQFYLLVGLRPKTAKHLYRGEDYSTACSTNTSFVQRQFHLEKGHDTKACCGNGEAMRRELPSNGNPFHSRAPYEAYLLLSGRLFRQAALDASGFHIGGGGFQGEHTILSTIRRCIFA